MSLVLKITNPTGTASGGIAANKSHFYQLNDTAFVVTGDNDTIVTSANVAGTAYTTTTLVIKVGRLGRNGTFDELLSS
jgi:hypothetical protein